MRRVALALLVLLLPVLGTAPAASEQPAPTQDAPLAYAGDPNLQLTRAQPTPVDLSGLPYTGAGITVAVVDSGIDSTHPDLRGRVLANVKLTNGQFVDSVGDTNGHGTHVAGIVAADGASSGGKLRGVAPGVTLVGIDISEKFTTSSALLAYDWLFVNREKYGIRVVVNAWGRVGETAPFTPDDSEIRAIDRLVDAGVVVVFSASNHGPGPSTLSTEASDPRVVTVGAVDAAAQLMSYSSRGPVRTRDGAAAAWIKPDIVAPGDSVLGLRSLQTVPDASDPDTFHRAYSGTSQAAPHVGGIVALMLEANPALTPVQVQNALRESAVDLGAPGPDDGTGFGLVDAADAVRRARGEAADRQNVLVAGGSDSFEDDTRIPAPQPRAGGILGFATSPMASWSTTFPVKSGASYLQFDLAWSSPVTSVTVTLETLDGRARGTWSQPSIEDGRAIVRGRLDSPETGIWVMRVHGAAPVALDVSSRVDVALLANATRGLELDARYRLPDTPASLFTRAAGGDLEVLYVQARLFLAAHPGVAPSLLAGFLFAFVLLKPRPARRVKRLVRVSPWASDAPPVTANVQE